MHARRAGIAATVAVLGLGAALATGTRAPSPEPSACAGGVSAPPAGPPVCIDRFVHRGVEISRGRFEELHGAGRGGAAVDGHTVYLVDSEAEMEAFDAGRIAARVVAPHVRDAG